VSVAEFKFKCQFRHNTAIHTQSKAIHYCNIRRNAAGLVNQTHAVLESWLRRIHLPQEQKDERCGDNKKKESTAVDPSVSSGVYKHSPVKHLIIVIQNDVTNQHT